MLFKKGKQAVRIEPWGKRFVVSSKRKYVNDSPDLVMVMSMLMRRGFEEYSAKKIKAEELGAAV